MQTSEKLNLITTSVEKTKTAFVDSLLPWMFMAQEEEMHPLE